MEVIRTATIALQRALTSKGVASALIGGTALRLVEGLPRMSDDLDLKVTRATAGSDDVVIETINATEGWTARKANERDEARELEGIVITDRRTGTERAMGIDLIPGRLGPGDSIGVEHEWLCEREQIMTYPTHVLGQLKMQTLIGERPRQLVHDVFDVAWFMDRHGHLVDGAHRAALEKWLENAENPGDEWKLQFERRDNPEWDWEETTHAMRNGLERANEAVQEAKRLASRMREVHRRTGDARVRGVVDASGQIWATITGGDGNTMDYGHIWRTEVIAVALEQAGQLEKRAVPELILTLEREREREQERARARQR